MRINWDTVWLIMWCIAGVLAAQTVFDAYDPVHCLIVCPEKSR